MTTVLQALQAALAAEQAIVYGYGVVGARLPETDLGLVTGIWDDHRRRRDALAALVADAGASPVAARPAYALPFPVHTADAARRLARHLEDGGAGAAWDLVAASPAATPARRLGVAWLARAGRNEAMLTGTAAALPGSPPSSG